MGTALQYIGGLLLYVLLVGLGGSLAQVTGPRPLLKSTLLLVTLRALPPVLSTTAYEVDSSKPVAQTAVEMEDLACGKSHLCYPALSQHQESHCFNCSKFECMCDDKCHVYGDCCVDMAVSQSPEIRTFGQAGPSDKVCQRRFPKKNKDQKATSYIFMISRCPENSMANPETISKCENADVFDYQQATPVTDNNTELVYRNSYCAQCFGVKNYMVWKYNIQCEVGSSAERATNKKELWELVLNDTRCTVSNAPPSGLGKSLRPCIPNTESTCNVTGSWSKYNRVTEDLCKLYYAPVEDYDKKKTYMYTNVFCAMCNGVVVSRKKQCFKPPKKALSGVGGRGNSVLVSKPLSVLIDFNADPIVERIAINASDECKEGQIYDPLMGTCSPLQCSRRRILTNEMCEPLYRTSQGLGYMFSLAVAPTQDIFVNATSVLTQAYQSSLSSALQRFRPVSLTSLTFRAYSKTPVSMPSSISPDSMPSLLSVVRVRGRVVSDAKVGVLETEQALRDMDKMAANMTLNNVSIPLTTRFITCPETDEISREGTLFPGESFEMIARPNFARCLDGSCLKNVEYMPIHSILDCPHIEIDLSQVNATFEQSNQTLTVFNHSLLMENSSYNFCGNTLKICAGVVYDIQKLQRDQNTTVAPVPPPKEDDLAMAIVSLVCIILSLICLFITFAIYCIVPQLRTLPGKNTMALIFHLFCAQLIFQVGIQQIHNRVICRAMGILIHYFWLTAYGWMAISAFHMRAVFSNMAASGLNTKSAERKTLARYIVMCNVYAVAFIASCVIYHVATTSGQEIGYGGHICFLNEPVDIGIFFAMPLALVLVFNVVCFIRTVLSIRSVPDMTNAKNKPNKNHVNVYFRLSILLGFTWAFGFVAAILRTNVWWYIFIILNGLQGVFIFVAYCLNKRTLRHLKSRFSEKGRIKYSGPSRTTSSSDKVTHSTTG